MLKTDKVIIYNKNIDNLYDVTYYANVLANSVKLFVPYTPQFDEQLRETDPAERLALIIEYKQSLEANGFRKIGYNGK